LIRYFFCSKSRNDKDTAATTFIAGITSGEAVVADIDVEKPDEKLIDKAKATISKILDSIQHDYVIMISCVAFIVIFLLLVVFLFIRRKEKENQTCD
jgi:preprotein translocase subunit YajC